MAASVFSGFTTLLIGVVITNASAVAYWSLAMTSLAAVQSLYSPITNSLYPHMVNNSDYRFARKLAIIALPIVLVGTGSFALFADTIMLILGGEEYLAGSEVLVWVSPVLFFSFFAVLFGWPISGAYGKVSEVTRSTVVSGVFCIATLLIVSISGYATLQVICAIRCITEALLFGMRFWYALPILRGKEVRND